MFKTTSALLTITVLVASPARAETSFTWADPDSGDFGDPDNWLGLFDGIPDDFSIARFDRPNAYVVTFQEDRTIAAASIHDGFVAFDLLGNTFRTNDTLYVGRYTGDDGSLTLVNGTVACSQLTIGHEDGARGDLIIVDGAVVDVDGTLNLWRGGVYLVDGTLRANVIKLTSGVLGMTGGRLEVDSITNDFVHSAGTLATGNINAGIVIDHDYVQERDARLEIGLGGAAGNGDHDMLVVTDQASLAGALDVVLIDDFVPTAGDEFLIVFASSIRGTFHDVSLPHVDGMAWEIETGPQTVTLRAIATCTGDVNADGMVDVVDMLAMFGAWGVHSDGPADLGGDGVVDVTDFLELLGAWGACH